LFINDYQTPSNFVFNFMLLWCSLYFLFISYGILLKIVFLWKQTKFNYIQFFCLINISIKYFTHFFHKAPPKPKTLTNPNARNARPGRMHGSVTSLIIIKIRGILFVQPFFDNQWTTKDIQGNMSVDTKIKYKQKIIKKN
jgi:hypothetical protein